MLAFFTEDFHQKFGCAVDDLRVRVKVRLTIYKSIESDDLFDAVERADFVFDDGESVENNHASGGLRLLDGDDGGHFADDFAIAIDGESAGEEEEIAAADAVDVCSDGSGDAGEGEAE